MTNEHEPSVRFYTLGGLGEVGMNCAVLDCGEALIVIDCGVNFPDIDAYGIDLIIPDFSALADEAERIEAVVITHGHQDHIGALPYLLALVDVPVYAPSYAMGLIRKSLAEHKLLHDTELIEVSDGETVVLGPFSVEYVRVNHSIPDTFGLAIQTPVGLFVHTADFKVDYHPFNEPPIALARFAELGRQGVRALLSDSTNIERSGFAGSESLVVRRFTEVFGNEPGCIFVTLFSTNMFRVQAALDAAHANGRRVVLLGRSLQSNVGVARELGIVRLPSNDILLDIEEVGDMPRNQLVVLCTGSQGQPRAALTRLAWGDFPLYTIQRGDTIIFSAREIPGNERLIHAVRDRLVRLGAKLMGPDDNLHVSGHACREEQKLLIALTRPLELIPVHGDHRFLVAHAALGKEMGVKRAHVLDNGDVLEFTTKVTERRSRLPTRRIAIDNMESIGALDGDSLRDRKQLARRGVCIIWLAFDTQTGTLLDGPFIVNRGAIDETHVEDGLLDGATEAARKAFQDLKPSARTNREQVSDAVRVAVTRFFRRELGRRPVVESFAYPV